MHVLSSDVTIGEAMRARLAKGEAPVNEEQLHQHTVEMAREMLGFYFSPRRRAEAVGMIEEGRVDAGAWVKYEAAGGEAQRAPLVHLVTMCCGHKHDDERIVRAMIAQTSPNLLCGEEIPLFAYAFARMMVEQPEARFSEPWHACVADGRMDIEIPYRFDWHGVDEALLPGHSPPMTLVNQYCRLRKALAHQQSGQYRDGSILVLMQYDPVVDPAFADVPELAVYRRQWQKEYDQLVSAIAAGDEATVRDLLGKKVVAHAFSLGMGEVLADRRFWRQYGELGLEGLLGLPDWVKARLEPQLAEMTQDAANMPVERIENGTLEGLLRADDRAKGC